jgi:hypothetical protein
VTEPWFNSRVEPRTKADLRVGTASSRAVTLHFRSEWRVGDFYASGIVSGPVCHQRGSLLELSWGGSDPIAMADGTERSFVLDGDYVTIGARPPAIGGGHLDMGAVTGTVNPAVISVHQQLDQ